MHVKLTCLAMMLALPLGAMATNWTGTESEDWFDSANWSDGVPNASTNSVRINTATPNPTLIEVGQAFTGTGLGIGHSGPGELMISSGASLESISASIGNQLAGQGLVVITGSNTSWATTGTTTFDIGHFGSGELEIVQGAQVYTGGDSGVGRNSGAFGKVLVVGTGSSWEVDGWIRVGWPADCRCSLRQYPILSAAEGLSGQFSEVIDANQNAFQLVHDGDTVYLQVSDQLHRDRYELEP